MAEKNDAPETEAKTGQEYENKTVNRRSQKTQNLRQKSKACRRLDFRSDHENEVRDHDNELRDLISLSDEQLQLHRQKGIEKWNFDFENEIPLEGDWEWEKIPAQPPETKEVVYVMEKKHKENRTV